MAILGLFKGAGMFSKSFISVVVFLSSFCSNSCKLLRFISIVSIAVLDEELMLLSCKLEKNRNCYTYYIH